MPPLKNRNVPVWTSALALARPLVSQHKAIEWVSVPEACWYCYLRQEHGDCLRSACARTVRDVGV